MKKKAISNIIATVLLILLALAAIIVSWSYVREVLKEAGEKTRDKANLLQIKFSIIDESVEVVSLSNDISFLVQRDAGEQKFSAFPVIVLEDSAGFSKAFYYEDNILYEYQRLKIEISKSGVGGHELPGALSRIFVFAALINAEGKMVIADSPSDVYEILLSDYVSFEIPCESDEPCAIAFSPQQNANDPENQEFCMGVYDQSGNQLSNPLEGLCYDVNNGLPSVTPATDPTAPPGCYYLSTQELYQVLWCPVQTVAV